MDIDPAMLKQLYETFSVELEEQSQVMVDSLLLIEGGKHSANDVKAAIDAMFRSAHTIKGAANSVSFANVAKIAHSLESIFSKIKNGELEAVPSLINICLKSVDAMKLLTAGYVSGASVEVDSAGIIAELENYQVTQPVESNQPSKSQANVEREKVDADIVPVAADSLRVDVKQLDKLSAMLDELSLSQLAISDYTKDFYHVVFSNNQLSQSLKQFLREAITSHGGELPDSLDKLSQLVQDLLANQTMLINEHSKRLRNRSYEMNMQDKLLQEEFRLLRLVPASVLFCTMPRQVRDLSLASNKIVELGIKGDDVRIDKMVLEAIKDPVIHILRNAIDHGIEDAETRVKKGKNKAGKLNIEISDRGSQIAIVISDDGAGINLESVKEIAIAQNLVTKDVCATLNQDELIEMLFIPGFSTKKEVTAISGRGVGLDVVRSNLQKIKGSIEISSVLGQGTTFTLLLPLTLSSERGVLVKAGEQVFAIPTASVDRILRFKKEGLIDVAGRQAVIVNDHTYPAFMLSALLDLATTEIENEEYLSAVIIMKNQARVLLLVDEIIGEHEIVIKQIQSPLTGIPCVSGGTLMDGNQVVVVLNPHDLIEKSTHKGGAARISFTEAKAVVQERPSILVVDDSITTRTLEKNILESKNYNVSVAVNGKDAWDYIQKKKFSLVITDVNMPIMDGFQLTERIKQHDKFKSIPVIIVTSLDSDDEKRRGLEVGANAYIVKNEFESGALIEIVKQLV